MKITTSLTQTREIEVPVPSFYKEIIEGSSILNVLGILDEKTVVSVWVYPNNRTAIENSVPDIVSHVISRAITGGWEKITEEEFFTQYNNAMESLSLTPKLTEL